MKNTLNDFDADCIANAVFFTAIRGRRPKDRIRMQFATIEQAKAYAMGFADKGTLIYAVTAQGRSAPILGL